VVSHHLLLTDFLEQVEYLVLGQHFVVRQDHLIQSAIVGDDSGDVATDVSQIGQGYGRIAIPHDFVVGRRHGIIQFAGFEAGVRQLVPPADVDDRVREAQLLDVIVDSFFLSQESDEGRDASRGRWRPTSSLNHMIPPGGATVMKPQGMNRLTPAFFAALASGI
jgi:hypothetical protein